MICPKCKSDNCQFISQTDKQSISVGKGICGYILLGPLGLLCGFCGLKKNTNEYWMCNNCGNKFQAFQSGGLKTGNTAQQGYTQPIKLIENANPIIFSSETTEEATDNIHNKGLVAHCGDYTYYTVYPSGIVRESRGKKTIIDSGGGKPNYLFADTNNLYYVADINITGKSTKSEPVIHIVSHTETEGKCLSPIKVDSICCYKEYIYFINKDDSNSVYRMGKDGGNPHKLISLKTKFLIVYKDKIYFLSDKLKCSGIDGTNIQDVVVYGKVTYPYFIISNDILYYESGTLLKTVVSYVNLVNNTCGIAVDFGGLMTNGIKHFNIFYGNIFGQDETNLSLQQVFDKKVAVYDKSDSYRWIRHDLSTNETFKYGEVPFHIEGGIMNAPTVNIANGMIYFGDKNGVRGRMPINGGKYTNLGR